MSSIREAQQLLPAYLPPPARAPTDTQSSEADPPPLAAAHSFSPIKIGCNGIVLLRWSPSKGSAVPSPSLGASATAAASAHSKSAAAEEVGGEVPQARTHSDEGQAPAVLHASAALLRGIEGGEHPRLQHCQRVQPVMLTCLLEPAALKEAAAQLVAWISLGGGGRGAGDSAAGSNAVASSSTVAGLPDALTFGVGFKDRSSSNASADVSHRTGSGSTDKAACIAAVAAGFESGVKQKLGIAHVRVDLKSPDQVSMRVCVSKCACANVSTYFCNGTLCLRVPHKLNLTHKTRPRTTGHIRGQRNVCPLPPPPLRYTHIFPA
jgi:hypothetical protein